MVKLKVELKVAVDGGNGFGITSIDIGVEILILEFRFEEISALWRFFMAGTKTGAAFGIADRTSLPTAMAVILVEGKNAATFLLIQVAASDGDSPIRKTS